MTLATRKLRENALGGAREALLHRCDHPGCSAWAPFGFGVALRKGQPGRWYCQKHKGEAHK